MAETVDERGVGVAPVRAVALVAGRVQGVGFRDWVRRVATPLGVRGAATNLRDGRVEVVAEGESGAVNALLDALYSGRSPGRVSGVEVSWPAPAGEPAGFRIR